MMWAHYTENHEGICLELDEEVFLNENANHSHISTRKRNLWNER